MTRILRLPLLAAALAAVAVAPAHGASKIVVRGGGFGHGIGMSQYGAYGYAKRGTGYADILKHYYTGVDITQAPDDDVRVLLRQGGGSVAVAGATGAAGHELERAKTYVATKTGINSIRLTQGGQKVATVTSPLTFTSDKGPIRLGGSAINGVTNGTYRGSLEVSAGTFGGLAVVNSVSPDDYVRGVIPGEVPASWPADALKAQAVAARSYGIATSKGGKLFDQYPDTRSQVYGGESKEADAANKAVDDTAGQVISYKGKVAQAYFFSASGGKTENVENVFYGPSVPYLRGVDDPFDGAAPKHRWKFEYTRSSLGATLGGLVKGRFKRVDVVKRGFSPRIVSADVVGSGGKTRVRGADLKARLGWFDTWGVFSTVSSRAATTATTSSWLRGLLARPALAGRIDPAPKGRRVTLERRSRSGRWKRVRRGHTSKAGAYRLAVPRTGVYRVAAAGFAGPPVKVKHPQ